MINKKLVSLVLVVLVMSLISTAASAETNVGIDDCIGDVVVPILVTSGDNVGAVDITLSYDPSVVTVVDVVSGEMDIMIPNTENIGDGNVRIAAFQVGNGGLCGEFSIANIHFKPLSEEYESCELDINVTTLRECTLESKHVAYSVSGGTYETIPKDDVDFFWEILIVLVCAVIFILGVLFKKQKREE